MTKLGVECLVTIGTGPLGDDGFFINDRGIAAANTHWTFAITL